MFVITTAIPEVNPTVTGYGTNSIKFPSRNNPTSIKNNS